MTIEAIELEINSAITSEWPTLRSDVPIVSLGEVLDVDSIGQAYVEFEVQFTSGRQIAMSTDSPTRVKGTIHFSAFTREGNGWRLGSALRSVIFDQFKTRTLGVVQLETPSPGYAGPTGPGWLVHSLSIPFWSDD